MNRHYSPTPGDIVEFSNNESESENGSPVPSENFASSDTPPMPSVSQRRQAQRRDQRHLEVLEGAGGRLSQTVGQHLLTGDFADALGALSAPDLRANVGARDDGGDGDSSSPDSSLSWLSNSPTNPDCSSDDEDSNSRGGSGCKKPTNKRPHDDDDDPEGEGSLSKKSRLCSHSPPTSPAGSTGDDTDPDNQQGPSSHSSTPNPSSSFSSQATVEDETIEICIGRQPYVLDPNDTSIFLPFDDTRTNWPLGVTELPEFSRLGSFGCNEWRRANRDIDVTFTLGLGAFTRSLAMLHMRFKRTFLHEPDEAFSRSWILDGSVFSGERRAELRRITDVLIRNGEIRRAMMETYEPEMLRRVEAMPKPRPANPKITVQKGTFEDPESFKSGVHVGRKVVPQRQDSVDETRLSPNEARPREGRTRYIIGEKPKESKKKRESP